MGKQLYLFGEEVSEVKHRRREDVINDYDGFVEKFKPKKTTDDCYTPVPVYSALVKYINENVINEAIGVKGVHINSALVSAQVRKRIYWTNIKTRQADLFGLPESAIPQPVDRGILLKDILQDTPPKNITLKMKW